jgi:hypothetical protein
MLQIYHRVITSQALSGYFSPRSLEVIIAANLDQDHWLRGQIGHPEYHFDQNAFAKSRAYVERNRALIRPRLEAGNAVAAQQALGRLIHAAQDFYAHSNYVSLWLDRFPEEKWPPAEEIDPLDEDLLNSRDLRSGKVYFPVEPFSWIPGLAALIVPLLPRDSHAWMNLDSPARGPKYAYAFNAAVKSTRHEFELSRQGLSPELFSLLIS